MTYRFTAGAVGANDDEAEDDCLLAGVSESADGDGFVLIFMCDFEEPDEEAGALELDTHCVVTADQGTAYGCVREAVLRDNVLRVVLDPGALPDLGLDDPVIEAELAVPSGDVDRLRAVLSRVLSYGRPDARPSLVEL